MNTRPSKTKTLILAGPTASGKTGLLDRIFGRGAARFFNAPEYGTKSGVDTREPDFSCQAEIISADSMQAYRGMDIGTAKPDSATLGRIPHHLIDIRDPDEQYTAGDFVRLAHEAERGIRDRGRLPVLAGGTGFYIRNYLCGVPSAPAADPEMRSEVAADLARLGPETLREELARTDPVSASRIHANDIYRITRALEIVRTTGRPLSDFAAAGTARPDEDFLIVGLERPRDELVGRIESRVDEMFAAGLVEEVKVLAGASYGMNDPGMKAIGYREFFDPDSGKLLDVETKPVLDVIRERIKLDTKRYAKRQMTYFRALPGIVWIRPDAETLGRLLEAFMSYGL